MPLPVEIFVNDLNRELEPLRAKIIASSYARTWIEGSLNMGQVIFIMQQLYAYLREIPTIVAAWINCCPDSDSRWRYIQYLHEEAPHPEWIVDFAKEIGRGPEIMHRAELIPEFGMIPYYYYWLSRGHIVEIAAANNFASEGTNPHFYPQMAEAAKRFYGGSPSLVKFFSEHGEQDSDHSMLGDYMLRKYAITDELQRKARRAAIQALQIKILAYDALYREIEKLR